MIVLKASPTVYPGYAGQQLAFSCSTTYRNAWNDFEQAQLSLKLFDKSVNTTTKPK